MCGVLVCFVNMHIPSPRIPSGSALELAIVRDAVGVGVGLDMTATWKIEKTTKGGFDQSEERTFSC